MSLTEELSAALKSSERGIAMIRVLENAQARGVTRLEAQKAVQELLDRISDEPSRDGVTSDADLTTEMLMITQNWCQERHRIWAE